MASDNDLNEIELKRIQEKKSSDTPKDDERNTCRNLTRGFMNRCNMKTLKRKIPLFEWLPIYEKSVFFQDCLAGLSVGLTAIPQSIAYAVIAGFSPEYGLYSVLMGSIVYIFFGSCKDLTIGPTAIMSLMVYSATNHLNLDFAVLGTFLYGCVILSFGVLNLGFLIQFVSMPVIVGFTTSAVITIASSQVKPLFGIKSGSSNDFIASWKNIFSHLDEIEVGDTILGLISILMLIILKKPKCLSRWPTFSRYISISRNAIVVIIGMIAAYIFHMNNMRPFRLTGTIKEGFPEFKIPPFETQINEKSYGTLEMIRGLGLSLITLPLVSILESIAIAKAFSKGKTVNATQEMIALGFCNIASSFVYSIPIAASFGRTAVNHNSGVKTTLGGLVTSLLVLLALGLLTKTFYFIPKTTLAAVIMAAIASMLETHEITEIYRIKRSDLFPFLVTLIGSLVLSLEFGILAGIVINFMMGLYKSSRPTINFDLEKIKGIDVLIVTLDQSLNYSSAEYFKSVVSKACLCGFSNAQIVFIDGKSINDIDITVVKNISSLIKDISSYEKEVIFMNWSKESVQIMLKYDKNYESLFKSGSNISDYVEVSKKGDAISQISEITVN